jgi:hypothetical protein
VCRQGGRASLPDVPSSGPMSFRRSDRRSQFRIRLTAGAKEIRTHGPHPERQRSEGATWAATGLTGVHASRDDEVMLA